MYGKLFASMYDGTLYGQWQAIVTLQQMVVLADRDGVLDMTPPALSAKTSIPREIIETGIEQLSQPDKYSRSDAKGGRRIALIDESRPWGWRIVNYAYYRDLASKEDKRAKDRERIAQKRAAAEAVAACRNLSQPVADSREQSESVADVAHVDVNADLEVKKKKTCAKAPGKQATGSRLPADWALPADWKAWAAAERPDIDPSREASVFRDYWVAQPGAKGRKTDWLATWRNWIRRANASKGSSAPAERKYRDLN